MGKENSLFVCHVRDVVLTGGKHHGGCCVQHQQLLDHDRGPVTWAIDVSSDEAISAGDSHVLLGMTDSAFFQIGQV